MKTGSFLATTAAVALLTGCSYYPNFVYPAHEMQTRPQVYSYPQSGPTTVKQITWQGEGALGPCVAEEVVSGSPVPLADRQRIAQETGMDPAATQQFMDVRTGFVLACGVANPLVKMVLDQPTQRNQRQAAPVVPSFTDYQIVNSGRSYNTSKAVDCESNVVLVRQKFNQPSVKAIHGPTVLREFGNVRVPAGWSVPLTPVMINGKVTGSETFCTQAKMVSVPSFR